MSSSAHGVTALPLIYIAGPFRGRTPLDVRRNVEEARDYGMLIAACGGYPIIPHTMTADFDKQLTDDFWLQGTLTLLQRCDGIVATPRWGQSVGARAEVDWAVSADLPVYYIQGGDAVRWGQKGEPELAVWVSQLQPRLEVVR